MMENWDEIDHPNLTLFLYPTDKPQVGFCYNRSCHQTLKVFETFRVSSLEKE